MRKDFETPVDFAPYKLIGTHSVEYKNLKEIAQGSPTIGQLEIDSELIAQGTYFGGPYVSNDTYIFIPMFVRNFFSSGFKLVRIDIISKQFEILVEEVNSLLFLQSFSNGVLFYYDNLQQTDLKEIIL